MNKIVISVEEAMMLEAMKTIRKLSKDKTVSKKEAAETAFTILKNTNDALDLLGVE